MKVLVIDNDIHIREAIVNFIQKLCPQVSSIYEADGVVNGLNAISNQMPEIVFLDVEMNDGTGFDLIQKLGNYDFQLVFITAHNKYAVNAFKFSAIDFLLKPIDPLALVLSINKATAQLKNRDLALQIKILEESLHGSGNKNFEKKIALKDDTAIYYVKISDIIYCMADGAYTVFYLLDNRKIVISKLLKEYEDLFEEHNFIRTHRSYLVNISKILKFHKANEEQLILEENHSVPVSSRKKDLVLTMLNKF